jgi:2,3-bisphosphoglycerate-dependent phosphoglycerate mutase
MNPNLVLLRHGQSTWNLENRFTGWFDCDLSEHGEEEARAAGVQLNEAGLKFDCVYTSVLTRAIRTMWLTLEELDQAWLPVTRAWELNERHYGALQGLNKGETAAEHGEEQVHIWRRSFDIPPPALDRDDERHARHDRRYAELDAAGKVPDTESLAITLERVLPYFDATIAPELRAGKNVLIVAHGNSLRGLVKHLDGISNEKVTQLNIPTGMPLAYELTSNLEVAARGYLAGEEAAAEAAAAVANQGKAN